VICYVVYLFSPPSSTHTVALSAWDIPVPYEYTNPTIPDKINRIAVFASYSNDGRIADYVIKYLKELKKTNTDIVFISDSPIFPEEVNKIEKLVLYALFERHGEYDFGSYKRGLNYILAHRLLTDNTELILCNDSVYGPFYPLSDIFYKMNAKKVDFWGMTDSFQIQYHLQSYFLYFKNSKLIKYALLPYLNRVKKETKKRDIVYKYEVPLAKYLHDRGYKIAAYNPIALNPCPRGRKVNQTISCPLELIEYHHFPFLKRSILLGKYKSWKPEAISYIFHYIRSRFPEFYSLIKSDLEHAKK
ncbi:MAG: rhamnan synthesis F family protein, partial [Pseudomonadota bacterium]|nr:rhamnan synthesis F family protein [Pseudomonadota bacterium]